MADVYSMDSAEGYQSTRTYRGASPARRRQLNRYKKECGISDEQMYLLLFKADMEALPDENRNKGDFVDNIMLVVGFMLLWSSLQMARSSTGVGSILLIFLSVGSFLIVAVVRYLGLLNPYKRTMRQVEKLLKEMPEVPDFNEWDLQNPVKEEEGGSRSGKKRRRR